MDTARELPSGHETVNLSSVQGTATVGVFDGFFLAPTVGGFGSIDLSASAHWIKAPRERGFDENVTGWGIGGRLGVLRESFTLPGVSLSVSRRWVGETELWSSEGQGFDGTGFDLAITSVRGVVGKDIFGVGLFGGAGWDRYSGDADITVPPELTGTEGLGASGSIRSNRRIYFLGGSLTFLALQVSGELGLAEGFDAEVPATDGGGFDPGKRASYGSIAIRLTF
jgi:hypothetical protein